MRIEDKSVTAEIRKGTIQWLGSMLQMLYKLYVKQPIQETKEKLNKFKIGVTVGEELK